MSLDCPYEFIGDVYYLGGYRHISSDAVGRLRSFSDPPAFSRRASESDYYAHGLGADVGFALKLNDRANLAAIFGYRWNRVSGEGDFADNIQRFGVTDYGFFNGSTEENFNGHTFSGSLLVSSAFTDKVTFGAGLKFGYTRDRYESNMVGFGVSNGALVDRDGERRYRPQPRAEILPPRPRLRDIDEAVGDAYNRRLAGGRLLHGRRPERLGLF